MNVNENHYLKEELYKLIKTSDEIFDFIQSSTLDGLWYWDLENPEEEWMNDTFWTTIGYEPSEMPHKSSAWQDKVYPEDLQAAYKNVGEHLADPTKPFEQIFRYIHKNGSTVWIKCRGLAVRDKDGKPIRMLGAHNNITAQKEQELALIKTNNRLNEILSSTGDIVFILDKKLKVIELFNRTTGENHIQNLEVDKKISNTNLSKNTITIIKNTIKTLSEKKKREQLAFEIDTQDGSQWYEMVITRLATTEVDNEEIICVIQNITKRKAAEKQLIEKTEELNSFFSVAVDLLCISDLGGRFIKVNASWTDALGYSVEELNGSYFIGFVHPDDVAKTMEVMGRLAAGKKILSFTNRYLCKDGTYKYLEWRSKPIGDLIFAIARDITESKIAADELQLTKELLEQTSKVAGVGGWNLDLVNQQLTWSDITKIIHEVEPDYEPCLDQGINFYKEGSSREIITKVVDEGIKTGKGWDVELQITTAKGNDKWVRAIGIPEIENGECKRIYGTFQDIEKSKQAKEKLEEALSQAEQAAEAKSAFLSNMSHEIRTPLNAVIGMTHLLMGSNPRQDQLEKLKTLKFSGDNLLALVNDILDYNKIESGMINFENIPFSLFEMTHSLKQAFTFKAEEKGIKLKIQFDSDIPKVIKGDPTRLVQILNNLMGNAIKFTEKGKVGLYIELLEENDSQLLLQFEISDTGVGISQDKIDVIFERFTQANESTTRQFGGTGLGLSIVKKLLELQESNIEIESELGKGSRFKFKLRFDKAEKNLHLGEPDDDNFGDHTSYNLEGLRVLLVEDNMTNRLIATEFLSKWNVALDYAENGFEAVEKVAANDYDVVLMDIQMPEMDGYQATMRIKQLGEDKAKIPILAMTASTMLEVKNKIREMGMEDHILKPFNPKELNAKLAKFVKMKKQNH
ncbi:MAG: hypothetical protein CMO01_30150 [Thalassobius sp.]|nr:hypothetical protein [Thalassovita sp.]